MWGWALIILLSFYVTWFGFVQVHGDYSEDVGVKLERPAEEPVAEPTEVVGA